MSVDLTEAQRAALTELLRAELRAVHRQALDAGADPDSLRAELAGRTGRIWMGIPLDDEPPAAGPGTGRS